MELPKAHISIAERPPMRPKLRTDTVEPKLTNFITLIPPAALANDLRLTALPVLV
jgi:hypothetical protein